jgi:hypothetical protein
MIAAACLFLAGPAHTGPGEDSYATDERGRRFRIRFDPASQISLGLHTAFTGGPEDLGHSWELGLGYSLRSVLEFVQDDDRIRWQLDHRVLGSRIGMAASGDLPELDLTAYAGSYLRHTDFPYLTLPTDPPRRFYFPFDIGMQVEAGRLELSSLNDTDQLLRLGVVRAAVLLDPWRSGRDGNSLEFGLGVRYHLDILGDPGLEDGRTIHRVAPFTDLSVRFRYQDADGLTVLDLQARLFPHWASSSGWTMATEGIARMERVLVAVNDQPVALVLSATFRDMGNELASEIRLTAGLQLGFQL